MLASLDARGAIDPDSGLLANAVFWRNLNRAIDDADKRASRLIRRSAAGSEPSPEIVRPPACAFAFELANKPATWLGEHGVEPWTIESLLNHWSGSRSGIAAV